MFSAESSNSIGNTSFAENKCCIGAMCDSGVTAITLFDGIEMSELIMVHLTESRSVRVPVETNFSSVIPSFFFTSSSRS